MSLIIEIPKMTSRLELEKKVKTNPDRVINNDEFIKDTPAFLYNHTPAFSFPSNFLLQEWHDKGVRKILALFVLAVVALLVTSPIATN
jgi:hypothetical protein